MAKRIRGKTTPAPPPPPSAALPFVVPAGATRYFSYSHTGRDVARIALNDDHMIHYQSGADYSYQNSGWHGCWREEVSDDGLSTMKLMFRYYGDDAFMLRNVHMYWDSVCRQYIHLTLPIAMKEIDMRSLGGRDVD